MIALCLLFLECGNPGLHNEYLSNNCILEEGGHDHSVIRCDSPERNVYSTILDYEYNNDFIIIKQTPNREDYKSSIAFELSCEKAAESNNAQYDKTMCEQQADSILKQDSFYISIFKNDTNYWIISHKEKRNYGPLNKSDFGKKFDELKIPKKLRLKAG